MVVPDNKFVFICFEKYIVLSAGKICWAIGFHLYSLNIRLQKDKFSRQHFKKISRTLLIIAFCLSNTLKLVFHNFYIGLILLSKTIYFF